jgi:hypothetical protein
MFSNTPQSQFTAMRRLMCYTKCKVKQIEIKIESDLVLFCNSSLVQRGETIGAGGGKAAAPDPVRRWDRRVGEDEAGAGEGCTSPTLDVRCYLKPARARRVGSRS